MSGPVFLVTPLPLSSSPVWSSDFDYICSGVLQEINSAASLHEACPSDFIPKQHVLHISEPIFLDTSNNDACVHDAPVRSLHCTLRDAQLKSLVMSGPYELKALHLQGQDLEQQGKWKHPGFPAWPPGSLLTLHVLNKVESEFKANDQHKWKQTLKKNIQTLVLEMAHLIALASAFVNRSATLRN